MPKNKGIPDPELEATLNDLLEALAERDAVLNRVGAVKQAVADAARDALQEALGDGWKVWALACDHDEEYCVDLNIRGPENRLYAAVVSIADEGYIEIDGVRFNDFVAQIRALSPRP